MSRATHPWADLEASCPGWRLRDSGGSIPIAIKDLPLRAGGTACVIAGAHGASIPLADDGGFLTAAEWEAAEELPEERALLWLEDGGPDWTDDAVDLFREEVLDDVLRAAQLLVRLFDGA